MSGKYDHPPAYPGAPATPQAAYTGASGDYYNHGNQGYNQSPGPGGYYQQNPQMGYHQQGPYQQGPYPPPQGYHGQHPPQGYYQDDRGGRKPGCLEGMLAALACCCCLDLLF
jgi:hypothetical protein